MAQGDRLADKVAVITGGASGFGEATARLFVDEGANVVVADIQDDKGQAVADSLGGAARYLHTDVTSEADVAGAVDAAVATFGRLDVMFNNAGIVGASVRIDEIPLEEYEFTMAVLLRSVFLGMKHAARVMKPQRSGVHPHDDERGRHPGRARPARLRRGQDGHRRADEERRRRARCVEHPRQRHRARQARHADERATSHWATPQRSTRRSSCSPR